MVKVAYASDESEAELLQGLLRTADVNSVVRRSPGFDVPEFLAAGPRDVLREVDPGEREPPSESGPDRRSRVLAALLIPVALVGLVVCLATDVIV